MSALKPVAGLTSGLLARKGAARPAMRSQLFASLRATPAPASEGPDLDDLGWNDMGDDTCPPSPSTDPDAAVARLADPREPVPPFREYLPKRIHFATGTSLLDETPLEPESEDVASRGAEIAAAQPSSLLALSPPATREARRAVTVRVTEERYTQLRDACHDLGCTAQRALSMALEQWLADRISLRRN